MLLAVLLSGYRHYPFVKLQLSACKETSFKPISSTEIMMTAGYKPLTQQKGLRDNGRETKTETQIIPIAGHPAEFKQGPREAPGEGLPGKRMEKLPEQRMTRSTETNPKIPRQLGFK